MNKDREFTESKTIKQNTKMKKRILGAALLVAIAVLPAGITIRVEMKCRCQI